jgi:hypothetical protein
MTYITDTTIANAITNIDTATQIEAEMIALRKQMIATKLKIQRMLSKVKCDDDVCAENPVYDSGFDLRSEVEALVAELHNASNISAFDVVMSAGRIASKYDIEETAE